MLSVTVQEMNDREKVMEYEAFTGGLVEGDEGVKSFDIKSWPVVLRC